MSRLVVLDRTNWESFMDHPKVVLMLGKSDCQACKEWTAELETFLETDQEHTDVQFGKLLLDTPGMVGFKKANPWIKDVDQLPFTVLFRNGEQWKSFAGKGVDRLTNRLARL